MSLPVQSLVETLRAAGQGYGLRCGTGAALWIAHQN